MIRYEIEKMIFNGDVDVKDLPKIWNEKYEEYLGVITNAAREKPIAAATMLERITAHILCHTLFNIWPRSTT